VSVFARSVPWLHLLYEDKDYSSEAALVEGRVRHDGASSGRLLDRDCATGVHVIGLARRGWSPAGIDLSHEMIAQGTNRAEQARFEPPTRSPGRAPRSELR
jgi:2-polyprenyl-3-methyl-5-hydroxy-6-metoxy-1,4-benzoquinol methylase